MSTTLIKSRRRGARLDLLTIPQQNFVLELLADDLFRPTEAARKAGYKNAPQAANKLLKNKKVQALLGKAQREREERCELKADDVLNYLRAALFFNPLEYFHPTEDGKWSIVDLDALPEEIGRLIDKMEVKVIERNGEIHSSFKVELISKATALSLAIKHLGLSAPEKHEHVHGFDWEPLYEDGKDKDPGPDSIDDELLAIESNGNSNSDFKEQGDV